MLRYWPASQWLNVAGSKTLVQPFGARLAMSSQPARSAAKGGAKVTSECRRFVSGGNVGAIGGRSWVAVILMGLIANGRRFRAIVSGWQRNCDVVVPCGRSEVQAFRALDHVFVRSGVASVRSRATPKESDQGVGEEQRRHVVRDDPRGTHERSDFPERQPPQQRDEHDEARLRP